MNRSCFHANRGYLIGVTVIVLCLLAVLHPGTKARLTFSKEVAEAVEHAVDAPTEDKMANTAWARMHHGLVRELEAVRNKGADLLWYGDSIVEELRGTQMGKVVYEDVKAVFGKHFGSTDSVVLGIAGDTSENLLWRIQHGESPDGISVKGIIVLIGTNDLLAYHAEKLQESEETGHAVSASIIAVCEQLLDHAPSTKLFLIGLLPRGDRHVEAPAVRPLIPNRFTPALKATNERLEAYASGRKHVSYLNCEEPFLEEHGKVEDATKINTDKMPDVLHPNAEGWEDMISQCITPALAGIVKIA